MVIALGVAAINRRGVLSVNAWVSRSNIVHASRFETLTEHPSCSSQRSNTKHVGSLLQVRASYSKKNIYLSLPLKSAPGSFEILHSAFEQPMVHLAGRQTHPRRANALSHLVPYVGVKRPRDDPRRVVGLQDVPYLPPARNVPPPNPLDVDRVGGVHAGKPHHVDAPAMMIQRQDGKRVTH